MTIAERIFEAAKPLPEPLAREALDFIEYLRNKHSSQQWLHAQMSSLQSVWDNPADEIWDHADGR